MDKTSKDHSTYPHASSIIYALCAPFRSASKQEVSEGIYVLGGTTITLVEDDILRQIPEQFRRERTQTFFRLELKGEVFYSKLYSRPKKRNSYTICYSSDSEEKYGRITKFLCLQEYGVFAVVSPLVPTSLPSEAFGLSEPALDYTLRIVPVKSMENLLLVPVARIKSKCVYIDFPGEASQFVAVMNTDVLLD